MKKIKLKVKYWLAKKLHKQLLQFVMLNLTNEEIEFLCESYNPNEKL